MSVNNVNQGIDIQKLLQQMKTKNGNVAVSKKTPEYMTKNGSIFNAQNTNQISGTNARVQSRGIQGNQTANNVVSANTAKSVANVSNTTGAARAQNAQNNNAVDNKNDKVDLSQYDFDNLTSVSDSDLQNLKSELQDLKDSDLPRFVENSVNKKLGKVHSEINKRASGSRLSEDNQKAEDKAKTGSSIEDGKSSVADSKEAKGSTSAATIQTENGTAAMDKSASEMKSLDNKMQKDDKKIEATNEKWRKGNSKCSKTNESRSC